MVELCVWVCLETHHEILMLQPNLSKNKINFSSDTRNLVIREQKVNEIDCVILRGELNVLTYRFQYNNQEYQMNCSFMPQIPFMFVNENH